jgi:hypothetical protein
MLANMNLKQRVGISFSEVQPPESAALCRRSFVYYFTNLRFSSPSSVITADPAKLARVQGTYHHYALSIPPCTQWQNPYLAHVW